MVTTVTDTHLQTMDEYVVDTILSPTFLITNESGSEALINHSLIIRGGVVVDVLPTPTAEKSYSAAATIDMTGQVLLPGFVDAHCYASLCLGNGSHKLNTFASRSELTDAISPAWAATGSAHGGACALLAGTTTLGETLLHAEPGVETGLSLGLRLALGHALLPFPSRAAPIPSSAVRRVLDETSAAELAASDSGVIAGHMFVLEAPGDHAIDVLERVAALVRRTGGGIKIVLRQGETHSGHQLVSRLGDAGLLTPHTVVVHPAELSPESMAVVVEAGARMVYVPQRDARLRAPTLSVAGLEESGIVVGLGSCGGEGRTPMGMLDVIRMAALSQGISAAEAIRLGTSGSAAVLGLGDRLGMLTRGMQADCIAFDLSHPALALFPDPLDALVFGPPAAPVLTSVYISGQTRLDHARESAIPAADLCLLWQREGWVLTGERKDDSQDSSSSSSSDLQTSAVINIPGRGPLKIDYEAIMNEYLGA